MKTSLDCHLRRRRSFSFRQACLSQSGGYDSASLPIRRSFSFLIRRSFSFLIRRSFSFPIRWFWFYFPAAGIARLRPAAFSGSDSWHFYNRRPVFCAGVFCLPQFLGDGGEDEGGFRQI
ncbi:hypothetical protein LXL04_016661 [Taraxacum kok-saghyz]